MLVFTSLIFLTNSLHAFIKKYYLYSFLFFCLTLTSVLVHSYHTLYTNLLDKLFIISIVFYGAFLLTSRRDNVFLIVTTFFLTIFLYSYGYCTNQYCYGPHGDLFHALLHFISSFGHHLIIL